MWHYYAQKKYVKNGQPQTPINYSYATRNEAERQYFLLCASAIANGDGNDVVSVEWGTIEAGAQVHRCWEFTQLAPENNEDEQE